MKTFVSGRPYWWQWLTILSLDATVVAIVWQTLAARVSGVTLRPAHTFVLGASVWCAYTADRWIEGWRLTPNRVLTQRHYFAVRWRWPLLLVWSVVFASDLAVAFEFLQRRELVAGAMLVVPVLLYLFSHQFLHRHHPWRLPKEVCIAVLLCSGVVVFVIAQPHARVSGLSPFIVGFVALCFANCALISRWEREVDQTQGQDSLAKYSNQAWVRALPWTLAASALGYAIMDERIWSHQTMTCFCLSGFFLGAIDLFEPRTGRQFARVLADVALLSPLFFLR